MRVLFPDARAQRSARNIDEHMVWFQPSAFQEFELQQANLIPQTADVVAVADHPDAKVSFRLAHHPIRGQPGTLQQASASVSALTRRVPGPTSAARAFACK